MDRKLTIAFLTEKSLMLDKYLSDGGSFIAHQKGFLAQLAEAPDLERQVKFVDHELNLFIRAAGGKPAVAEISTALKRKFGFGALSEDPDAIARKVLKRGTIVSEEEGQVIRDLLADGPWCESFGEKRALTLERIFSDYEKSLRAAP